MPVASRPRTPSAADVASAIGALRRADNRGWRGPCPVHESHGKHNPSMDIDESATGVPLFSCRSKGCSNELIIAALQARGIWPTRNPAHNHAPTHGTPVGVAPVGAPVHNTATQDQDKWLPVMPIPVDAPAPNFHHYELGNAVAHWTYRDAHGQVIFYACRFNLPDKNAAGKIKKEGRIRTYCRHSDSGKFKWSWKWPAKPRPLYNWHLLHQHPSAPVMVFEGEKTADAGQRIFPDAVCVTWIGGSKNAAYADWKELLGRDVIIWPDADHGGLLAGQTISQILADFGACNVSIAGGILETLDALSKISEAREIFLSDPQNFPAPGKFEKHPEKWQKLCILARENFLSGTSNFPAPEYVKGFDIADAEQLGWSDTLCCQVIEISAGETDFEAVSEILPDKENQSSTPRGKIESTPRENFDGSEIFKAQDAELDRLPLIAALGFDHDTYYYLSRESRQVIGLPASSHKRLNLLSLISSTTYWESAAPGRNGANWDVAAAQLMSSAKECGVFSSDLIRGRGAWIDASKDGGKHTVLHLGDRLIVDGAERDVLTRPGRYVYEWGKRIPGPRGSALTDIESSRVLTVANMVDWRRSISGTLFAGWLALAPICGALDWRPHVWVTGGQGSGKSYVSREFLLRLSLGEQDRESLVKYFSGNCSESGIRQALQQDALAVIFDEAEGRDSNDQNRIQTVLHLMRQSSDGAKIVKGTTNGRGQEFTIRSMFCLISIAVHLNAAADASRTSVLELGPGLTGWKWESLRDEIGYFDREFAERLVMRTLGLVPVIRANARMFGKVAAKQFGSQRLGDQYGTLLAGAYSLHSADEISAERAGEIIQKHDWTECLPDPSYSDEDQCLQRLLQHMLRVELGSGPPIQRTVGELIASASWIVKDDKMQNPRNADEALRRIGIRVDRREGCFYIANHHREMGKIMSDTSWGESWCRILRRFKDASGTDPISFTAGVKVRAVKLPLSLIDVEQYVEHQQGEVMPF